jgi:uncharacterized protein with GYD domain
LPSLPGFVSPGASYVVYDARSQWYRHLVERIERTIENPMNSERCAMKTFVLMTKIAARDALLVEVGSKLRDRAKSNRAWLEEVKKMCPEVRFKAHYALLGHWDFMDIYEAPDEETAAKVSLLSRARGSHIVESWMAIPYERILEITEEIDELKSGGSPESEE